MTARGTAKGTSNVWAVFLVLIGAAILIHGNIIVAISTQEASIPKHSEYPPLPANERPHEFKSPVCFPSYGTHRRAISRIFFMHMRKAGGSTIHMYLKKVAKKWNLQLDVAEGTVIESPGNRSDTLYVTHLREPIARVISHFKYEARWPCEELVENNGVFVPTLENARDFETWMDKNQCRLLERGLYGTVLWECSANCYVQWLNYGRPTQACNPSDVSAERDRFVQALATLKKFHLIIDVERLFHDREYGAGIEHYFGKRGLVGSKIQMYCGRESAKANKNIPLFVGNATMNRLKEQNRADSDLFETMTRCPDLVRFPGADDLRLKDLVVVRVDA
jgi:hypothetical protein